MAVQETNVCEITKPEECRAIFSEARAVIFKHSRACRRSQAAYRIFAKFCSEQPNARMFLISVLDSRSVSVFVEKETGVTHESPQVLALRKGVVFAHAAHHKITSTFLNMLYPT